MKSLEMFGPESNHFISTILTTYEGAGGPDVSRTGIFCVIYLSIYISICLFCVI